MALPRTIAILPSARACVLALALALVAALAVASTPAHAMESQKLSKNVCKTTGGGEFVRVPHSDGARIDKRLLPDVRWMQRRFDVGLGDGYAPTGHSPNGEHPIGLAFDIYSGNGRSSGWDKIDALAKLAEPRQNQPKLPWRWVGYDGDAGHGRGHHLHLSWGHNDDTTPRKPAKWVLTRICPGGSQGGDGGGSGGGISTRSGALPGLAPAAPETD